MGTKANRLFEETVDFPFHGVPQAACQAACGTKARVRVSASNWQMLSTSASENRPSGPVGARSLKGGS